MSATKKPMGTRRDVQQPYLIVTDGDWEYRILKAYTSNPDAPFARWYAAIRSPFTFGGFAEGDTYILDITGTITFAEPDIPASALPRHLPRTAHLGACLFLTTDSCICGANLPMPEAVR